jgi:hypothetical protein
LSRRSRENVPSQAWARPRKWRSWIADADDDLDRLMRRLDAAGSIHIERRRRLRIMTVVRVTVVDPAWRPYLVHTVETALGPVAPHDAALTAIAGAAAMPALLTWRQRWAHRERIRELVRQAGPVPRAMRSVLGGERSRYIS